MRSVQNDTHYDLGVSGEVFAAYRQAGRKIGAAQITRIVAPHDPPLALQERSAQAPNLDTGAPA